MQQSKNAELVFIKNEKYIILESATIIDKWKVPYKEKDIEKKYYSIGEVADMLGIATSVIRFWETEFDILKPKKNRKGNRQFTAEDIENTKLIYHLVKVKGYTLAGAKEVVRSNMKAAKDKKEIVETLNKLKTFLLELKSKIS